MDAAKAFPRSFKDRLRPSINELGRRLPIVSIAKWNRPKDQRELAMQAMAGPPPAYQHEISLTAFADFADEMEWVLPDWFPRMGDAVKSTKKASWKEIPLEKKERESLLTIIAALVGEKQLEHPSSAAENIERKVLAMGLDKPKQRRILDHLNRAKAVIADRKA
jgi:hypothetical protein